MPENPDRKIIELYRQNQQKEAGFNLLVAEYSERLYWHIRRIVIDHQDADDVLQNTLVKVWKNLANFRAESGLFTWLFRIATNESLSLIKTRKKHLHSAEDQEFEKRLSENLETDPWFDGDEIQMKLQQAILSLPEKQRLVFNLKYFEDMKYEEMADTLDTSVGALKASYHHAVKKIEKYITGE
jgi:RNA polymerase sigma-70 factor (ECF subfamily)